MAWNKNYGNSDVLSIGQIILGHLNKILDISSHELRSSERILILDNQKQIVETEDTRLSFIQAVESFAYTLLPYFDKSARAKYKEEIIFMQGFGYEIMEKIDDATFKEKLESANEQQKQDMMIAMQIRHTKLLFIELNELLLRVDYLKAAVYGDRFEDDDDTLIVEEDDE